MRKRSMLFFTAIFGLSLLSLFGVAQTPTQVSLRIKTYLSKLERQDQWSGAALVAIGDRIIVREGYGFANRQRREPFTPSTKHHVASISKMMTAFSALQLRDAGKLKLEASVCQYFQPCPKTWQAVQVQHLIHHSSGIPDYEAALGLQTRAYLEFMTKTNATERILEEAFKKPLEFKPGLKFKYSNTAYIVLSKIIEVASKLPFNDAVNMLALEPNGLKNSGMLELNINRTAISTGYTTNWRIIPELALTPPAGDAALISTVDDLYQWSLAMDKTAQRREVFTPRQGGYGWGWFIDSRFGQRRYIHTGELPGYRTVFVKYPNRNITIILFSNQDRAPMEAMTRDISTWLLNGP
jgi:CubicO group peptidase (beta-lactamase class C family)